MAEMGEMEMPMPDNTLPMMTGFGQFGPMEMGGMFTVVKVREGLARGDYKDPGWYKHPPGTVAYEVASASQPARKRDDRQKACGRNERGQARRQEWQGRAQASLRRSNR